MCASWFSVDCYASIHNRKYPGYSLLAETRLCFPRMMDLLSNFQQRAYTLFKMWPSLVIGSILRDIEFSTEFLTTITVGLAHDLKTTPFFLAEVKTSVSPTHDMLRPETAGL